MKIIRNTLVLCAFILLIGCTPTIEPIEDIDITEYSILVAEEEYILWQMDIFPTIEYGMCDTYDLEVGSYKCLPYPGDDVWIVQVDNQFYPLRYGIEEKLYTTEDLIEFGIFS